MVNFAKGQTLEGSFAGKYAGAFTLAEVLITLGIIGIVAAMTLPTVINNHKRVETETRLKKAYSTISQAFQAAQAKHGEVKDWPEWDESAEKVLRTYILPELKGAKLFPSNENPSNLMCHEGKFITGGYINGNKESTQYGWMSKTYISSPFIKNDTASVKLMDGTCIGLNSNKAEPIFAKNLFIDVNGSYRAPNMAGMVLFFFIVDENMIRPWGYDWETTKLFDATIKNSCHRQAPLGGRVCAAKIIGDGWTIKYW